jgi:hypothetical protein
LKLWSLEQLGHLERPKMSWRRIPRFATRIASLAQPVLVVMFALGAQRTASGSA